MRNDEYLEQVKIFEWAKIYETKYPPLKFLNSSQNGIKTANLKIAVRAKKAGMRAGFPDIFLPYPNKGYAGLFIELKRPLIKGKPKPVVSKEQLLWIEYLNSVRYSAMVAYGATEAIEVILNYLN